MYDELSRLVEMLAREMLAMTAAMREAMGRIEEKQQYSKEKMGEIEDTMTQISTNVKKIVNYIDKKKQINVEREKGKISLRNKLIIVIVGSLAGIITYLIRENIDAIIKFLK